MKKLALFLFAVVLFYGCSSDDNEKTEWTISTMVHFNDKLLNPESEFTTTEGTKVDENYTVTSFKDNGGLAEFNHYYASWGFGGGFTYTNKTDVTTPGYTNISAITGKGQSGSTYLTVNTNSEKTARTTIVTPANYRFQEVYITNTTYAYLAIKDGNVGPFGGVRKFAADDYFKLTITGYSATDKKIDAVEFYLADFRNGKTDIVNTWKLVDLKALASAKYITFALESTDNDPVYGMNTPAYFCLDGLTLTEL